MCVHVHSGQPAIIYGALMSPGTTVDDAAQRFWTDHGTVFCGNQPELTRRWAVKRKASTQTIIAYSQSIRGIPVEGANARVLITAYGGVQRVRFVSARLAGEPTVGVEQPLVPHEVSAALVKNHPGDGNRGVRGQPELVVLLGNGQRHAMPRSEPIPSKYLIMSMRK